MSDSFLSFFFFSFFLCWGSLAFDGLDWGLYYIIVISTRCMCYAYEICNNNNYLFSLLFQGATYGIHDY